LAERSSSLEACRTAWDAAEGLRGYTAWREEGWAWLALTGPTLDGVLGRLCAVDLRQARFAHDAIAQTRFAGMDAVVLRNEASAEILFDIAATADMLTRIAHAASTEGDP
jgi:sarcosine oxidase subunit gamma